MNDNDYRLYHHGIRGMKWGIRRYQNEDGSLTEAGKKHYGYASIGKGGSRNSKTLASARSKSLNEMSDDELAAYNKRLQAEKQFAELTRDNRKTAKDWVKGVALTAVTSVATTALIKIGNDAVNSMINKKQ